jgi:predicted amidohydrolase
MEGNMSECKNCQELRDIQRQDYAILLDAWRERGLAVPGLPRQSAVIRAVLGIHELREALQAAVAMNMELVQQVAKLEDALDEVVTHARPAFPRTPFRQALDKAKALLKNAGQ